MAGRPHRRLAFSPAGRARRDIGSLQGDPGRRHEPARAAHWLFIFDGLERYDQRKNLEEAEANAIGAEFVRADLLSAEDAARVRTLLKSYVDQRIAYYTAQDEQLGTRLEAAAVKLQSELWSVVVRAAEQKPTPVVALWRVNTNGVHALS